MRPRDSERCQKVMHRLLEFPASTFFREPVGIPGYRERIQKPMDLGRVGANLRKGRYNTTGEWEADIDLIYRNACRFNGRDHPVSHCAKQMVLHFKKLKKQFFGARSVEKLADEYCKLCLELDGLLSKHPVNATLPQLELFDTINDTAPVAPNDSLQDLRNALAGLTSHEQQLQLIYLIRELEPRYANGMNDIQVNLSHLKPETIAKLQDYVASQAQ
jgi:hypothetical protein